MMALYGRTGAWVLPLVAALWLAGCGSKPVNRAPVEDRGTGVSAPFPMAVDPGAAAQRPPAGIENAGKAGYYTVKPGDTLIRIGLETGQNWKDVARWNGLDNPNLIEVGQVLRVIAPAAAPIVASAVVTRPVVPASVTSVAVAPGSSASAAASPTAPVVVATTPPAAHVQAAGGDDDVSWMWPAQGSVLAGFDEAKNKGLDIGGAAGDAVLAAADGRVVYVGASLRGYGNLIILKHNNTYLTAYAHNQALLVKEDQTVRKGQKIAEMGNSDADRVKLHFEVRRQGKPVDPTKYLPAR
jgi:lipoprotein NlpD